MIPRTCLCILLPLLVIAKPIAKRKERPMPEEAKNYIVVFKDSYFGTDAEMTDTQAMVAMTDTQAMVEQLGGTVNKRFYPILNGMAITLPNQADVTLVEQDERVDYITEDKIIYLDPTEPEPLDETILNPLSSVPWSLDRMDQPSLPLNGNYKWRGDKNAGSGVNVCVIDSGLASIHQTNGEINFGGGQNFVVGKSSTNDCMGHGTHVAGTVGSKTYGVAPGATIYVARVFSCDGGSPTSTIIDAVAWCTIQAQGKKMVINMSLAGGFDAAMNKAVANAANSGIVVVVAAGNDNTNACSKSPASEPKVITVGSTYASDERRASSNYGSCVDIFAPGSDVPSLSKDSSTGVSYKSGTSMASPHVAGVAALLFQKYSTSGKVVEELLNSAAKDKVSDANTTPNRLAQAPLTLSTPPPTPTQSPTRTPTRSPTQAPTRIPTRAPTLRPTTRQPTRRPTRSPTQSPTRIPTRAPTLRPTTRQPTRRPTRSPTRAPSVPTASPTALPTELPTMAPTASPTALPTELPTMAPTASPTALPT